MTIVQGGIRSAEAGQSGLVPFVSVKAMAALIRSVGLRVFLRELAACIEADFRRWPEFEKSARVSHDGKGGVLELMPTAGQDFYGFKYVTCFPGNSAAGKQTVTGFGLLSDLATGYPLLLTEMTLLTALRTAATSALVARHLSPPEPGTMAIIGNGAQSEFQAHAFAALLGTNEIRLYDAEPSASRKAAANLRAGGFGVTICSSVAEAAEGAGIVTTCTADWRHARLLNDNMIGSGVHVNAIGGDCPGKTELAPELLHRAEIYVEFLPQTRAEGECQQLAADHTVTELWQLLASPPRPHDGRRVTLFDSVGFALEDYSAMRYVRSLIEERGGAETLDLIASPEDPRDLFGLIGECNPQQEWVAAQ